MKTMERTLAYIKAKHISEADLLAVSGAASKSLQESGSASTFSCRIETMFTNPTTVDSVQVWD